MQTHKDCQGCEQPAREICIKDILIITISDNTLGKFKKKKLKDNDHRQDKNAKVCNTLGLENATKES